jgi:hypothetical protein
MFKSLSQRHPVSPLAKPEKLLAKLVSALYSPEPASLGSLQNSIEMHPVILFQVILKNFR